MYVKLSVHHIVDLHTYVLLFEILSTTTQQLLRTIQTLSITYTIFADYSQSSKFS
jgi:hypothetical protein